MKYIESVDIISKKVLNETSGELEILDFRQVKTTKKIKGGFGMFYKSYEEAVENIINSKLDWTILLEVKNQFTYKRIECCISATDISTKLGCTKSKVNSVISSMVDQELLMRVHRGVYRLNPYMVIPFRSDGEYLQAEWTALANKSTKKEQDDNTNK